VISIFSYELLFILQRELKVNRERLLNFMTQYPQIYSCAPGLTITCCDVFLVNHPIQFVVYEIAI
jgi:hypothetical protein